MKNLLKALRNTPALAAVALAFAGAFLFGCGGGGGFGGDAIAFDATDSNAVSVNVVNRSNRNITSIYTIDGDGLLVAELDQFVGAPNSSTGIIIAIPDELSEDVASGSTQIYTVAIGVQDEGGGSEAFVISITVTGGGSVSISGGGSIGDASDALDNLVPEPLEVEASVINYNYGLRTIEIESN